MQVTKETIIADLMRENPESIRVLLEHGLACVGCPASQVETLEEAMVHGLDIDSLMSSLKEIIK